MSNTKEDFKNTIIKGYELKFNTSIEPNKLMTARINNDIYSIYLKDNYINVHSLTQNEVYAYQFDDVDPSVYFTRYHFKAIDSHNLIVVGIVYSKDGENNKITPSYTYLTSKDDCCINKILFFADNYICNSPAYTLIKILNGTDIKVCDYGVLKDVTVTQKNPFHIINMQENEAIRIAIKKHDINIKTLKK